jgi:hypothetical protein
MIPIDFTATEPYSKFWFGNISDFLYVKTIAFQGTLLGAAKRFI